MHANGITYFFQLEIGDVEQENNVRKGSIGGKASQIGRIGSKGGPKSRGKKPATFAEELDNLMDISIEIASNKRMKKDHIKSFKLTFKDKDMEKKVWSMNLLSGLYY